MIATHGYIRAEVQDYLLGSHGSHVASCMANHLTAPQFLRSYGLLVFAYGVLPAIFFGTVAGWLVKRLGKSQRGQVIAAVLTTSVLTLLTIGLIGSVFYEGVVLDGCNPPLLYDPFSQ